MPARPKYQVFISSTYADLRAEREAVTWAVLTSRHIPAGMEAFTATDDRGWQTIKSVIDKSDYYVLILAGRYGSTDQHGISWTQREYEYAASKGIPILAFVRSEASITVDLVDENPQLVKKFKAFKKTIKNDHLCIEWGTKEELVSHVSNALRNHILDDEDNERARPGWYRGNELPATATLDEFARLSSEAARLKSELESLQSFMAQSPALALIDRNQGPVAGNYKRSQTLKIYHPALTSLEKMRDESFGSSYLVLNTFTLLEMGVQNIGRSLVEHVVLNLTLTPISGFRCGLWDGSELIKEEGRLFSNTVRPEYKNEYPEYARLDSSNQVSLRFRIDRISIGCTEYIPDLFVVGAVEKTKSWFSLKYHLAGSVGNAVSGECDYEINFDGSVELSADEKRRDEVKLGRGKGRGPIIWGDMLLGKWQA